MRRPPAIRILLKCAPLCLAIHCVVATLASAYTGGPIRAHIDGVDPTEGRVYFRIVAHDGAYRPHQVWFFDLDGDAPMCPVRVPSLENKRREYTAQSAWPIFANRLKPLRPGREFDISFSMSADTAGVDTAWGGATRYEAEVVIGRNLQIWTLALVMFGAPLIRVQCLYEVPERPEVLIVLTHRGRAYGCEEIDLPVLLAPRQTDLDGPGVVRWVAQGEQAYIERHVSSRVFAKRDEYQQVIWYMTERNTSKQYGDHASFDVEVYFGESDSGSKGFRFLTRYIDADSLPHQGEWIHYDKVYLVDDQGRQLVVATETPEKQSDKSVYGVMEWCDQPLTEDALLPFADSHIIQARFEGASTYEFDLSREQMLAIREIIKLYKEE
jgi:hypothetical protein